MPASRPTDRATRSRRGACKWFYEQQDGGIMPVRNSTAAQITRAVRKLFLSQAKPEFNGAPGPMLSRLPEPVTWI